MTRTLIFHALLALTVMTLAYLVDDRERQARETADVARACIAGLRRTVDVTELCADLLTNVQRADQTCVCFEPAFVEVRR